MTNQEIINLIGSYFKSKDVGIGALSCISENEDVESLASEISVELNKAYSAGFNEGSAEAASEIMSK